MKLLSDHSLKSAYRLACINKLEPEFIHMLEKELLRRKINPDRLKVSKRSLA